VMAQVLVAVVRAAADSQPRVASREARFTLPGCHAES
jgi:hypothetical protein